MAAVQTYKNLQDKVLRQLDEAGDTDTTLALVKDGLNFANTQRATSERWPFMLWDSPETFVTVIGQQTYALNSEFYRPFYFRNRTTTDYLRQVRENSLIESGADWNSDTGDSIEYTLWSRTEIATQPPVAGVLTLASSAGADNGARSMTIRGMTTNGVRSETITCGSSSSNQFTKVLKATKIGTWVGTLTLTAGAVTLLTLFPEEAGRTYQQLFILQIPTAAVTIEYRFYRQPFVMTADEDRPEIPSPFEDLLVYDTLLDFSAYNRYPEGVVRTWEKKRDAILLGLEQAYQDDMAIGGAAVYTNYIPR